MLWKHLAFGNSRIELCGYGARMRPMERENTNTYIKRGWFGCQSIQTHSYDETERDSQTKNNGNNKNNYHEKQRLQWWWCSEYLTVNTRWCRFFCCCYKLSSCYWCLYVCIISNLNAFRLFATKFQLFLSYILSVWFSLALNRTASIEQLVQQFICVPW